MLYLFLVAFVWNQVAFGDSETAAETGTAAHVDTATDTTTGGAKASSSSEFTLESAECPLRDWRCRDPLVRCRGPDKECYCDLTLEGNKFCWPGMPCWPRLALCSSTAECPPGYGCVTTCCNGGAPSCVPDCDHGPWPALCAQDDHVCGESQRPCGDDPDCYCDLDIDGYKTCWLGTTPCSGLRHCYRASDCPNGYTCAEGCCGRPGQYFCHKECANVPCTDWRCRDDQQGCGRNDDCYCDIDIDGKQACWLADDTPCSSMRRCYSSSDCRAGSEVCVTHCCGGGAYHYCTAVCP